MEKTYSDGDNTITIIDTYNLLSDEFESDIVEDRSIEAENELRLLAEFGF